MNLVSVVDLIPRNWPVVVAQQYVNSSVTLRAGSIIELYARVIDGGAVICDPARRITLISANAAWGYVPASILMRCLCATHKRGMLGSMLQSAAISSLPKSSLSQTIGSFL